MTLTDLPSRQQRVFRALFITLAVMLGVGLISLTVSLITAPQAPPSASPTTEIDYAQQRREQAEKERHERDRANWYTSGVNSVCRGGKVRWPSMQWGARARPEHMAQAIQALVKDLRTIIPPKHEDNVKAVELTVERGAQLEQQWAQMLQRHSGQIPEAELHGAVDQVRDYVQTLIDNGAKDCSEIIPEPNPPLANPPPA